MRTNLATIHISDFSQKILTNLSIGGSLAGTNLMSFIITCLLLARNPGRPSSRQGTYWQYKFRVFSSTINYLSNINCNEMINFDYRDNLLKRMRNLNNKVET